MMPGIAVGSTILRIVSHFGIPSAYDASRSSPGTSSISSVERTTTGASGSISAMEAAKPERSSPSVRTNSSVDEESDDDGRDAGHDVDEEAGDAGGRPRPYSTR